MDRIEVSGLSVAIVGHAALLAALTYGFAMAGHPPPIERAMEVSLVDEVALVSAAPAPAAAPAASAPPPDPAPVQMAVLTPVPPPSPAPARAVQRPRPPRQAPRRPLNLNLDGVTDNPPSLARGAPAAVMSATAAADIASAIARQVQPCADRQIYPGPGAERIVTSVSLRLNRDGSLAGRPQIGRQRGLDDENRRYAQRVADIAVAAFTGCAPLRGLPAELYDVPRGWSNFTLNYRLPG